MILMREHVIVNELLNARRMLGLTSNGCTLHVFHRTFSNVVILRLFQLRSIRVVTESRFVLLILQSSIERYFELRHLTLRLEFF